MFVTVIDTVPVEETVTELGLITADQTSFRGAGQDGVLAGGGSTSLAVHVLPTGMLLYGAEPFALSVVVKSGMVEVPFVQ